MNAFIIIMFLLVIATIGGMAGGFAAGVVHEMFIDKKPTRRRK